MIIQFKDCQDCILHVCGGDPNVKELKLFMLIVFSTYVEVIPRTAVELINSSSILHVCGGDPFATICI